jgi:hypothetical protein
VSIPLTRLSDELAEIELKDPLSDGLISWPKPGRLHLIVKRPPYYSSSKSYSTYGDKSPPPKLIMPKTPESLSHVTSQMKKRKFPFVMKPHTHDGKTELERLPAHMLRNPVASLMKWQHYIKNQMNVTIVDGCYTVANSFASAGPPVQLLHPAFAHFLDDVADETLFVPETILAKTFQFMQEACHAYDNNWVHNHAVIKCLAEILRYFPSLVVNTDGIVSQNGIITLIECTTAFDNGPDPAIQACFSMAKEHVSRRLSLIHVLRSS